MYRKAVSLHFDENVSVNYHLSVKEKSLPSDFEEDC